MQDNKQAKQLKHTKHIKQAKQSKQAYKQGKQIEYGEAFCKITLNFKLNKDFPVNWKSTKWFFKLAKNWICISLDSQITQTMYLSLQLQNHMGFGIR